MFHKTVDLSDNQAFRTRTSGGSLRLGFPLSENLWVTNSYTLSNNEISDVATTASLAIQEAQGAYWTSAWGTSLTYDTRNHPKNPTRGLYLQTGVDVAGLGGDVQYVRASSEGRVYYPITEKITFVGRAIGGHIEGWGGEEVRLLDLYYRGGETIRGFSQSGFGPRDLLTGDALGGKTYWSTTAEIRFPIPFLPEELGMGAAVFADAGSLFGAGSGAKNLNALGTVDLADSSTIRTSVGGSILWNSPLGPLRFDVAKALTKESFDKEQLIRFGASTKF